MSRLTNQTFDVVKDPLDLRDLMYEGSLLELPKWVDNRGKVPLILDQGSEGACTGFGLAATVNFLLHNQRGADMLSSYRGASARMLYEMAKRYDEWEGTNYDGSSIRGAMKGWHKHGVCRESDWPYVDTDQDERLTPQRQTNALHCPMGNYFRVRHLHLSHMFSAVAEVGILYASGSVHEGWDDVDPETGQISYRSGSVGGHAFAIVGYTDLGFWIQNSWGRSWGVNGFALVTYEDWLQNGWDCWVARLGVPTVTTERGSAARLGRALTFGHVPQEAVVISDIRPHIINIGNNGEFSNSGAYQTDEGDVQQIINSDFVSQTQSWSGTPRLMLCAHGGLNNEKSSAHRVASVRPYALANEIYPLHFMWETGLAETLHNLVADAFRNRRFAGIWEDVKDRFLDLADEAIELATRPLGRAVWGEMKENARLASADGGGADYVAGRLAQLQLDGHPFELHLVGHSAGSVLLGHLLPEIDAWGLKVKTVTLYAPACTTKLFETNYMPYIGAGKCVQRLTIFNLDDEHEEDDSVIGVYNKSLLWLVSEAFEPHQKTNLLGIDAHLTENTSIKDFFDKRISRGSTVIYSVGGPNVTLRSSSTTHGGFDNDPDTLDSTLRIVRGSNSLAREVERTV